MQRIEITKTFPFSVDKLFDFLSDHENLEVIFAPAKIKRAVSYTHLTLPTIYSV